MRPEPSARAACTFTTAGRRSASTMTTPQDASSKRASLRAIDRSRSICVCTSLNAQYSPAGLPSGPRTAADCVRTRIRPPSLVSSANSWTCRPGARIAAISRASTSSASAVRTAHPENPRRPTASAADQPRIRSASRFQWVTIPSASNAQSAASIPSSNAARRSAPSRSGSSGPSSSVDPLRREALTWHPLQAVSACSALQIIQLERDAAHTEFGEIVAPRRSGGNVPSLITAYDLAHGPSRGPVNSLEGFPDPS